MLGLNSNRNNIYMQIKTILENTRSHKREHKTLRFNVVHPIHRLHPLTISPILLLSSDYNPQSLTTQYHYKKLQYDHTL